LINRFLQVHTRVFLLTIPFVFSLLACSSEQNSPQPLPTVRVPTAQPTVPQTSPASPVPFNRYGETLIDVPYCTPDKTPQKMDVYFPEAGGPWPVLVFVHGGAWMRGDKSEAGMFARMMSARGYLVVSVNYRLYPEAQFPAMIQDVKCAVRSLRANAAQYNLDPGRLGAVGVSAGGHLVSLLGTTDQSAGWDVGEYLDQSSRVQVVIAMAGVMDLSRKFPNTDIEAMKRVGFGEYNVVEASPISHVTPDDPPFLLIHGDRDEIVPVEQSQLMYERLVQENVPVRLVVVTNAGHSFSAPGGTTPTAGEVNQILRDFLAQYLG
jgi:acetyl esterase/lipase